MAVPQTKPDYRQMWQTLHAEIDDWAHDYKLALKKRPDAEDMRTRWQLLRDVQDQMLEIEQRQCNGSEPSVDVASLDAGDEPEVIEIPLYDQAKELMHKHGITLAEAWVRLTDQQQASDEHVKPANEVWGTINELSRQVNEALDIARHNDLTIDKVSQRVDTLFRELGAFLQNDASRKVDFEKRIAALENDPTAITTDVLENVERTLATQIEKVETNIGVVGHHQHTMRRALLEILQFLEIHDRSIGNWEDANQWQGFRQELMTPAPADKVAGDA